MVLFAQRYRNSKFTAAQICSCRVQEYGALFSMLYDTQAPSTHRSTAGKLLGVSDTARMGEPIANYLFGENINPGATDISRPTTLRALSFERERDTARTIAGGPPC